MWHNIQALSHFPFTYGNEATSLVLPLGYAMYKASMFCVRCTFAQVQYYRGKILDWVCYTVASVMDKKHMRETTLLSSSSPESSQLGTKKSGLVRFTVSRLPPLWECSFDHVKIGTGRWNLSHPSFCTWLKGTSQNGGTCSYGKLRLKIVRSHYNIGTYSLFFSLAYILVYKGGFSRFTKTIIQP